MTNDKHEPPSEAQDARGVELPEGAGHEDAVLDPDTDLAGESLTVTDDDVAEVDYEIVDDEAEELLNADETVDDTPDKGDPEDVVIDDEEQLAEAEAVAAAAKSSRPKRKVTTAPVKKSAPTPTRRSATVAKQPERRRTTPAAFASQSVGELKKVIWPTGDQLREYYIVVLVFVLFIVAFVGLIDLGAGRLLLWLFGAR